MVKQSILDLISVLGISLAPDQMVKRNVVNVLEEINGLPIHSEVEVVNLSARQGVYAYPENAVEILSLHIDNRKVEYATEYELEGTFGINWRGVVRDSPRFWMIEKESRRNLRLAPAPANDTIQPNIPLNNLWTGYAQGALLVFFTERRENILDSLDLWVALKVMGRTFAASFKDHDPDLAAGCTAIADRIKDIVLWQ